MYFTLSFLTKKPTSTGHVIPQQGVYRRDPRWTQTTSMPAPPGSYGAVRGLRSLISRLIR